MHLLNVCAPENDDFPTPTNIFFIIKTSLFSQRLLNLLSRLLRGCFMKLVAVCTARNDVSATGVRHCEPRNYKYDPNHFGEAICKKRNVMMK